jgi:hypothetical protein
MALIIPVGFAQVTIPFLHTGSPREAVITFGVSSSAWGGDYQGMCDAILTVWMGSLGNEQDSEVTIGPVRASIGQDGGDPISAEGTATDNGGRGQATLPSNVALLVKKASNVGGRRGRGRFYVPWIIADGEAGDVGNIDGTALAAFNVDAANFRNDLALGTGIDSEAPMYILHDSSGSGTEPAPSQVTALVVDPLVATQRRRLRG